MSEASGGFFFRCAHEHALILFPYCLYKYTLTFITSSVRNSTERENERHIWSKGAHFEINNVRFEKCNARGSERTHIKTHQPHRLYGTEPNTTPM